MHDRKNVDAMLYFGFDVVVKMFRHHYGHVSNQQNLKAKSILLSMVIKLKRYCRYRWNTIWVERNVKVAFSVCFESTIDFAVVHGDRYDWKISSFHTIRTTQRELALRNNG